MPKQNFSVVITGEWPGAGQSTTAKLLAAKLGFTRVYAGLLQRKFAHIWNLEKNHYSWEEFDRLFQTNQIVLGNYTFDESSFNEAVLHQWQKQLKHVNTPQFWDTMVEKESLKALCLPGVVVEAKVGVLLDKIGLGNFKKFTHKVYKILLVCPPEISTHRVIKRQIENGEMESMDINSDKYLGIVRDATTETINRHLRDWERYEKIYGIRRSDIYKRGIIQIYTTNKEPEEVVTAILEKINP